MRWQNYFILFLFNTVTAVAQHDVLTQHFDQKRTGWHNQETVLTTKNIKPGFFGKLFTLRPRNLEWFLTTIEEGVFELEPLLERLFANCQNFPTQREAYLALLEPLTKVPLALPEALMRLEIWEREGISVSVRQNSGRKKGVQLLTVHAAKGLEFPVVGLVDLLRQSPKRQPMLRLRDKFYPGLRFRLNDELTNTASYDEISEIDAALELAESKRVLYVALTRAILRIALFLPETGTLPKDSWASWLSH